MIRLSLLSLLSWTMGLAVAQYYGKPLGSFTFSDGTSGDVYVADDRTLMVVNYQRQGFGCLSFGAGPLKAGAAARKKLPNNDGIALELSQRGNVRSKRSNPFVPMLPFSNGRHPFDFGFELDNLRVEDAPNSISSSAGQPGSPFDVDVDEGSGDGVGVYIFRLSVDDEGRVEQRPPPLVPLERTTESAASATHDIVEESTTLSDGGLDATTARTGFSTNENFPQTTVATGTTAAAVAGDVTSGTAVVGDVTSSTAVVGDVTSSTAVVGDVTSSTAVVGDVMSGTSDFRDVTSGTPVASDVSSGTSVVNDVTYSTTVVSDVAFGSTGANVIFSETTQVSGGGNPTILTAAIGGSTNADVDIGFTSTAADFEAQTSNIPQSSATARLTPEQTSLAANRTHNAFTTAPPVTVSDSAQQDTTEDSTLTPIIQVRNNVDEVDLASTVGLSGPMRTETTVDVEQPVEPLIGEMEPLIPLENHQDSAIEEFDFGSGDGPQSFGEAEAVLRANVEDEQRIQIVTRRPIVRNREPDSGAPNQDRTVWNAGTPEPLTTSHPGQVILGDGRGRTFPPLSQSRNVENTVPRRTRLNENAFFLGNHSDPNPPAVQAPVPRRTESRERNNIGDGLVILAPGEVPRPRPVAQRSRFGFDRNGGSRFTNLSPADRRRIFLDGEDNRRSLFGAGTPSRDSNIRFRQPSSAQANDFAQIDAEERRRIFIEGTGNSSGVIGAGLQFVQSERRPNSFRSPARTSPSSTGSFRNTPSRNSGGANLGGGIRFQLGSGGDLPASSSRRAEPSQSRFSAPATGNDFRFGGSNSQRSSNNPSIVRLTQDERRAIYTEGDNSGRIGGGLSITGSTLTGREKAQIAASAFNRPATAPTSIRFGGSSASSAGFDRNSGSSARDSSSRSFSSLPAVSAAAGDVSRSSGFPSNALTPEERRLIYAGQDTSGNIGGGLSVSGTRSTTSTSSRNSFRGSSFSSFGSRSTTGSSTRLRTPVAGTSNVLSRDERRQIYNSGIPSDNIGGGLGITASRGLQSSSGGRFYDDTDSDLFGNLRLPDDFRADESLESSEGGGLNFLDEEGFQLATVGNEARRRKEPSAPIILSGLIGEGLNIATSNAGEKERQRLPNERNHAATQIRLGQVSSENLNLGGSGLRRIDSNQRRNQDADQSLYRPSSQSASIEGGLQVIASGGSGPNIDNQGRNQFVDGKGTLHFTFGEDETSQSQLPRRIDANQVDPRTQRRLELFQGRTSQSNSNIRRRPVSLPDDRTNQVIEDGRDVLDDDGTLRFVLGGGAPVTYPPVRNQIVPRGSRNGELTFQSAITDNDGIRVIFGEATPPPQRRQPNFFNYDEEFSRTRRPRPQQIRPTPPPISVGAGYDLPPGERLVFSVSLPADYTVSDLEWFGVYDHCNHARNGFVIIPEGFRAPAPGITKGIEGWLYDSKSSDIHILNCNTLFITDFSFNGASEKDVFLYVGIGEYPDKVLQKIPVHVRGLAPGSPLRNYDKEDISVTLPEGWRVFDTDWIMLYNPTEKISYGFATLPSDWVPPCEEL